MSKSSNIFFILTQFVLLLFICVPVSAQIQTELKLDAVEVSQMTDDAFVGQQDAKILKINLKITGNSGTLNTRGFFFTLRGSSSRYDIADASMYFTGIKSYDTEPFRNTDTAGRVNKLIISKFAVYHNKELKAGDNFFYLTYKVSNKATPGNYLDGELDSLWVGDSIVHIKNGSPSGKLTLQKYANYCNISVKLKNARTNSFIGIRHVKMGGEIDNISEDLDTLTFYPDQILNVYKQQKIPVEIKYGQGYNEIIKAWVDWNNDGYLDEKTELAFSGEMLPASGTFKTNITVPCSASIGQHKIRILSDYFYSSKLTPCSSLIEGEGEEYLINVLAGPNIAASFLFDTSAYIYSPTSFINTSTDIGTSTFAWDYDNDGIYDDSSKNGKFTFDRLGYQLVSLKMVFKGCDTSYTRYISNYINIVPATQKPESEFISIENKGTVNKTFNFTDLSLNAPNKWLWKIYPETIEGQKSYVFKNKTSASSQNPVIQFLIAGNYSISLTTWNAAGVGSIETKKDYIQIIDEVTLCSYPANTDTVYANEGMIYDDGGPTKAYSPNSSCFLVIKPPCAEKIYLSFNQFDASVFNYGSGSRAGDYLRVYDGLSNSGKPLHDSVGFAYGLQNTYPQNKSIEIPNMTAHSGSIYMEWVSDNFFNGDGFEIHWWSKLRKSDEPIALFEGPDTIYRDQTAIFINKSTGSELQYFWDFDGDGKTDANDANPEIPFFVVGTYNVRLVVKNCGGLDTAYKKIYVRKPLSAPFVNFYSNYQRVAVDDIVKFFDQSTQGPYAWDWTIIRSNDGRRTAQFFESSEESQNPIIYFKDTGKYNITLGATNQFGTTYRPKPKYISVFEYCIPSSQNPSTDLGVGRIELFDINNKSKYAYSVTTNKGYYHPKIENIPYLELGSTVKLKVIRNSAFNNLQSKIWIDFNGNGDFKETGEEVASFTKIKDSLWECTIQIPTNANVGISRMRIGTEVLGFNLTNCGQLVNGSYIDFTLMIGTDTSKPIIKLLGKDTVVLEEERLFVDDGIIAVDNVDGDITNKVTKVSNLDFTIPGYYTVTYTVKDKAGNIANPIVRIIKLIPDTTAPTLALKGSRYVYSEVNKRFIDPGIVYSDNISNNIVVEDSGFIDTSKIGMYTKYYIVTDARGNRAKVNRIIFIGDTTLPEIQLNGDPSIVVGVYNDFDDQGATAKDNYWKNLTVIRTGEVNTNELGVYFLTYSVTDSSGNGPVNISRRVIVVDTISPELHIDVREFDWNVNQKFVAPAYTATDNYYEFSELKLRSFGYVNEYKLGTYKVIYYIVDGSYNISDTVSITVHVKDFVAPTISLLGAPVVTLKIGSPFNDPGFIYSDNYDTKPLIHIGGSFKNSDNAGSYLRTYQIEDHSGNKSHTLYRYIYVENTTSIDELNLHKPNFSLYPNPVQDKLYLRFNKPSTQAMVLKIRDALGREIFNHQYNSSQEIIEVDVEKYASGIYYLEISNSNLLQSATFLIQK